MSGPFQRAGFGRAENAGVGEVLRFRRPPLSERLHLILEGDFGAAGEGYPELKHKEHKEIAWKMRRDAKLPACVDPRWYCLELGVDFVAEPETRGCGGEIYLPAPPLARPVILYRPSIYLENMAFSVAHGLSHHLAETRFGNLAHVDTFLIQFEILCPEDEICPDGVDAFIAKQRVCPAWLARKYHYAVTKVPWFY